MFYIGSNDVKEQREASNISRTAKFHSTLRGGTFLLAYVYMQDYPWRSGQTHGNPSKPGRKGSTSTCLYCKGKKRTFSFQCNHEFLDFPHPLFRQVMVIVCAKKLVIQTKVLRVILVTFPSCNVCSSPETEPSEPIIENR